MAKKRKNQGSGLMSSAGLMRYYDVDDSAIKIPPKVVIAVAVALAVIILGFNIQFGLYF